MKHLPVLFTLLLFAVGCQQQTDDPAAQSLPSGTESAQQAPDKPMLPVYKVAGDYRPAKADSYDDYRDSHPELFGITNPASVGIRPVAEWEQADKLMITVSSSSLPTGIKQNLADIVKYGKQVTDVYIIYDSTAVKSNFTSFLTQNGVSTAGVNWLNIDNETIWVRDYGPIPIVSDSGKVGMVDPRYYHQRIYDDAIPSKLGSLWNATVYRAPLDFEGGNFMSDTVGNCFASQGLLWYNGVGQTQIEGYMEDYLGCETTTIMQALANEGTTHIDMQMKLVSDTTVIVGEYAQNADYQNYQVTNANAATFQSLGYNVVRMPMPSNSDGNFRTYINSLFVNGVNMVPVYSIEKAKEAEAMAIWEQVMPNWQHVPMNADDVIEWAGAIHCITMTTGSGSFTPMESTPGYACGGDWSCYPGGTTPTGCDGITYEGCCDDNVLYYCESNELKTINCGNNPECGWNGQAGFYDCGTNGASDPSGEFPLNCGGGCTPDCTGKECGSDGCGGSCGTCGANESCVNNQCVAGADPCDGITWEGCCDGDTLQYCENQELKSLDCSGNPSCGWSADAGYYDCGTNGSADPSGEFPLDCDGGCTPNCAGIECGADGCGGSCGSCGANESCVNGQCIGGCTPNCTNKECGDDGCGGTCGTCDATETCVQGVCMCHPDCEGIECGADGCGGSCGSCPNGFSCSNGQCVMSCVPDCTGKVCGDDGCGGSCGSCGPGQLCQNGQCNDVADPCLGITWEGCCEDSTLHWCENNTIKTLECAGAGCGWNAEAGYYDCNQTGADPSGDNPIECPGGECIPNCADKLCGDDGCGGSCGTCPEGQYCDAGMCVGAGGCGDVTYAGLCDGDVLIWCENNTLYSADCSTLDGNYVCGFWEEGDGYYCIEEPDCTPDCADKECGDDGCGGSCGSCAQGESCTAGICQAGPCEPLCTGKECGDDGCGGSCGTCPAGWTCDAGECVTVCQPQCGGKECGDDGCGGSCGTCNDGENCIAGKCKPGACTPDCAGKICGDDGCGGSCGACGDNETCDNGDCVSVCQPDCTDKECGDDGCGGSCGACPPGFSCQGNACQQGCQPDCAGKECGDDGCGGLCGSCAEDEICTNGTCAAGCTPDCTNKECGPDGCGGSCGSCPKDFTCDNGDCVASPGGCGNISAVGQCEGELLKKCVSNEIITIDCAATGKLCSFVPSAGVFDCVDQCIPNCTNKECGSDGCGGSCGSCQKGFTCDEGECIEPTTPCTPLCDGKECGDDGCGGSCGTCAEGQTCNAGLCTTDPAASDVVTGTDSVPEADVPGTGGDEKVSGGGCTTAGSNGQGAALLLLLVLGLAVLRRRTVLTR